MTGLDLAKVQAQNKSGEIVRLSGGGLLCWLDSNTASVNPRISPSSWNRDVVELLDPWTCQDRRFVEKLLGGVAVSLDVSAVALACTAIGSPAALGVEIAAVGIHILQFTIGFLDCQDTQSESQVRALIEQKVCLELANQGIACRQSGLRELSPKGPRRPRRV